MPVPVVETARTSPSSAKVPPVIVTVAPARLRLSASDTVRFGDNVWAASSSVQVAVGATLFSTGGSFTSVMLTVVVWDALKLLDVLPSSSVQVMDRVGFKA